MSARTPPLTSDVNPDIPLERKLLDPPFPTAIIDDRDHTLGHVRVRKEFIAAEILDLYGIPHMPDTINEDRIYILRRMTDLELRLLEVETMRARKRKRTRRRRMANARDRGFEAEPKQHAEKKSLLERIEKFVENTLPDHTTADGGRVGVVRFLIWRLLLGRKLAELKLEHRQGPSSKM